MERFAFALLLILMAPIAAGELVLSVSLEVADENTVTLAGYRITEGAVTPLNGSGYRFASVIGGEQFLSPQFSIPREFYGGVMVASLPYDSKLERLALYKRQGESLNDFAVLFDEEIRQCDEDGSCEAHETVFACPLDCRPSYAQGSETEGQGKEEGWGTELQETTHYDSVAAAMALGAVAFGLALYAFRKKTAPP